MRNDVTDTVDGPARPASPAGPARGPLDPPLLILATDDDAVCTDELCLPAEALPPVEDPA